MKKLVFVIFIASLLLLSFLAGAWYTHQVEMRSNPATVSSQPFAGEDSSPETSDGNKMSMMPPGTIKISPEKQQMIGVSAAPVEKKAITHTIRLLGRVAPDETRLYVINAAVDGWITKTLPNTTGSFVKKHEVLAAFYSPEFLSAEQALIYALSSMDRVQAAEKEIPGQKERLAQFNINLRQYRDALRNLGMGDLQIEELIRTRN